MRVRGKATLRFLAAAAVLAIVTACTSIDRKGTVDAGVDAGPGTEFSQALSRTGDRDYDEARARQFVAEAREAADAGDSPAAEIAYEQALDAWPVSKPAWEGLAEVYRGQGREEDYGIAHFFAARMDWVAEVPPLIASGAFENVAEGRVQIAQESPELRSRSRELVAFLRTRDARTRYISYDEETEFWELIPAAMVTALGAVITFGPRFGFSIFGD